MRSYDNEFELLQIEQPLVTLAYCSSSDDQRCWITLQCSQAFLQCVIGNSTEKTLPLMGGRRHSSSYLDRTCYQLQLKTCFALHHCDPLISHEIKMRIESGKTFDVFKSLGINLKIPLGEMNECDDVRESPPK
jgi:hypothetical protein